MSLYATKWAYAQPVKPAGRKFVLVAIADFADAEGRAFPGVNTIAAMTGQDERSVRRHIDALEESGYIKCAERRRKDGSRTTDEMWLQAPEDALRPEATKAAQSARRPTGQNARLQNQPDNLSGTTGQFDQTNRTICHPSPDNLSGRTEPSVNHHSEPSLKNTLVADATASTPPQKSEPQNPNPTGQGTPDPVQVDQSEAGNVNTSATSTEDVPPAAPRRMTAPARIIAAWNDNRGTLPEVQGLNEGRKKAITRLLRECGGDVEQAAQVVTEATREVAADEYWQAHRFGFDNLVPGKVFQRAEAWRSRQQAGSTGAPERKAVSAALKLSDFTPGQRVIFKNYGYTVAAVGEFSVLLRDDVNGETTVKFNSDYWHGLKPAGGQA